MRQAIFNEAISAVNPHLLGKSSISKLCRLVECHLRTLAENRQAGTSNVHRYRCFQYSLPGQADIIEEI